MKKLFLIPLMLLATLMLSAFAATVQAQQKVFNDNQNKTDMESNTIRLTIEGGRTFTATLVDNSSTQALKEQLAKGNITVEMEDYANMEKVGSLGIRLPRNDRQTTTGPGDIILYQGHNLVIYYDTNSWSFTRLGKIDNASQADLKAALGKGDVKVTLSLE
ncbi:MAG: hypothetical protein IAB80_03510 [Bacteroidetes bacterium]|uniref:Cyclophilin-like domain-containing protein n=2 Tax=Candidatus Cryptobacteroides TaxID=2840523 RepID=A0A9D9IU11_9BACT|nr:hypothetical protein [Candidatus Cryptobacteroides gallistercoris]MBO8477941.1 hypothetical protein [Candidatus Cryptobacteroides excrementipullorum]